MKRILSFLLLALSLLAAPAFAADFPTARVLFETGKTDVGPEGQAAEKGDGNNGQGLPARGVAEAGHHEGQRDDEHQARHER